MFLLFIIECNLRFAELAEYLSAMEIEVCAIFRPLFGASDDMKLDLS